MAKQLAFYVNIAECVGCKACQVACKDKNDLPDGIRWRRVFEYEGGEWVNQNGTLIPSNLFAYFVSSACMHCENPICLDVCPAEAISKRADGIVLIDEQKCVGCRYCSWACPYGAPQFNEKLGVMTKCTFCSDLVDQGGNPACVDACPYRALEFGDLEELRAKHGNFSDPAPLPDPSITKPSIVYSANGETESFDKATGHIMNLEEVANERA
jgi:anaerobic dimethyl sulfoxide reductase subunit B (iron-sulfur subunit)